MAQAPTLADLTVQNGFAIRFARQLRKLSVDDLAQRIDRTAPHVRNIENEHRSASPEDLAKIAQVLDVPQLALVRIPTDLRAALTEQLAKASVAA